MKGLVQLSCFEHTSVEFKRLQYIYKVMVKTDSTLIVIFKLTTIRTRNFPIEVDLEVVR